MYEEDATDAIPASVIGTTGTLNLTVDGDVDVAADITLDHGFYSAGWFIEDDGGNPLECTDVVDQNGVGILVTHTSSTEGFDMLLDCSDAAGFSQAIPLGDATVELTLLDGADAALGAADLVSTSIENGNEYVDLGDLTIVLF